MVSDIDGVGEVAFPRFITVDRLQVKMGRFGIGEKMIAIQLVNSCHPIKFLSTC